MAAGTRIAIGAMLVLGVTAYMAYLGAASSWQYYLSVDECVAQASSLLDAPIRVSGRVARDSLHVARGRDSAEFLLVGSREGLQVKCLGPLPDNLVEDRPVVVEGQLESRQFLRARRVLTRCASKYSSGGTDTAAKPGPSAAEEP